MKFAVCVECLDWVKLGMEERFCRCGRTGGFYLPDGLNAVIWGPCFAVGVDNQKFMHAVVRRKDREILASSAARRTHLRGEWWMIQAGVSGSHVEVFQSRRAAYEASRSRLRSYTRKAR